MSKGLLSYIVPIYPAVMGTCHNLKLYTLLAIAGVAFAGPALKPTLLVYAAILGKINQALMHTIICSGVRDCYIRECSTTHLIKLYHARV